MYDFLDQVYRMLRAAGELGEIDAAVMDLMAGPSRVLAFRIPLKMDDGSRQVFDAYRVRYSDALGPSRDGTRVSPDIDIDEVTALGLLMTIKHAAGHIPAGGGKGGVVADPNVLSSREFESLCRAYVRCLRPAGPAYDVPGADIGTDARAMAWMLDEYEQITGYHCPAAINDKPAILGGSLGGEEATGRGVFDAFAKAADDLGMAMLDTTVAIQGFGQVGSVAATMFYEAGCRVIAVSDSGGGIRNDGGLNVPALRTFAADAGTVAGFPGADRITNAELLETACTVLVPAAIQGVIHRENALRVKARLLVEAANAPTTIEAEEILLQHGVTVVPDVIANSGSVHVCQMERSQDLYDNYWDADTIDDLRRTRLLRSYREALHTAANLGVESVRLGAWVNALRRIEEAVHARGWL
ncbi:Glu/Leu/Phe/Val family dehydrogenase [Arhodomonas sp. AD133]|uniref:Glu/Leu/Phe/Val family dehydrogenase n=1 Tax=Arhodomonas sp. AD133 TaxID=3415009 RepID=UPI003EBF3CEB